MRKDDREFHNTNFPPFPYSVVRFTLRAIIVVKLFSNIRAACHTNVGEVVWRKASVSTTWHIFSFSTQYSPGLCLNEIVIIITRTAMELFYINFENVMQRDTLIFILASGRARSMKSMFYSRCPENRLFLPRPIKYKQFIT